MTSYFICFVVIMNIYCAVKCYFTGSNDWIPFTLIALILSWVAWKEWKSETADSE